MTTRGSPTGAATSPYAVPPSAAPTWPIRSGAVDLGALAAAIALAAPADAAELFTLQRACWVQEQQANPGVHIPPLHEDLADVQAWLREWTTLVLRSGGRLVGAVAVAGTARPGTSAG